MISGFLRRVFGSGIDPNDDDCQGDLACETEKRMRELRKEERALTEEFKRGHPADLAKALLIARDRMHQ